MKIIFLTKQSRLWIEKIKELRKEFPDVDFITDNKTIEDEIKNADSLISGETTANLLKQAVNLKMIFVKVK